MAYTYTDKYYYYYDATLTQTLLDQYVSTINPANSSGTHFVYLNNAGTMSAFTGTRHTPNPEEHSGESDVPRKSTQTSSYENFTAAVNVNFAAAWSAASAFGSQNRIPNGITLADDDTYAANITFANGGEATAEGNDTRFTDLTFTNGGTVYLGWVYGRDEEVVLSSGGLGNVVTSTTVYYATTGQKLNGLRGKLDFDGLYLQTGASASATDVVISRNMRELNIANDSGNHNVKNRTGNGTVVNSVTVSGRLNSVYVGSGALLNMLTVGLQRSFTSADISAFGYFSSSYFGSGGSWVLSSATYMNIESGGTASNIYLNNGGIVTVFGPEDRVSSTWNSTTQQYDVTTSYASGAGGTLTNLQMAMSGGLQFGGLDDSETWQESNGVYWSADYRSHHRAAAPQSAYVEFQSNTSGSNVTIGNGGSMRIGKGASVVGISMGALTTSTFHTSGGKQMTWVGDRGAKLTIDCGFASNVVVEGAPLTRDYFFAVNNDFSTLSSSIQRDYYESHGSYMDNNAASALASAGYNAYMSSRYTEIQGDYDSRYLGGEIIVNGGTLLNASGFAYLYAGDDPDWTFTSSGVSMTARTGEMVSKAVGALSATVEVGGAAHVTSITVAGGRFVMGGNSGGVTRWANQSNAQSNYAQAEYIDLRTSGLVGSNNSAMVLFGGYNGSGQQPVPVMSNGSQVYDSNGYRQWDYYAYECTDPGEIHYLTADKGLVVKDLGWGGQDFTYTGSGAVTINGLGTVVLKDNHERRTSDSYYGKGPYLGPAYNEYYFGVVKGVYDEENGKLQKATILNGEGGFDWKGFLVVGSGGIVQDIGSASPLKTGNDIVNSDTWTPSYTYDECKVLTVVAGGSADNVTVKGSVRNFEHNESQYTESRAGLLVSSGGTATNVTVLEGGIAMAKGGTIDKVFVGAGGTLYLSGWAGAHQVAVDSYGSQLAGPQYLDTTVLNAVRLDSGGQLTNTLDWGFRKGNAPSVIANAGGGILNGVTANGVAYVSGLDYAGNITLTNGQQGLDLTVRGYKKITSRDDEGNPAAYTTVIASLNVSSGGIVKGATVGEEGAIYVSEGADVSGLTASSGRLIFENAGSGWGNYLPASATVNGLAVESGGILEVNSKFGLTASNVQIGQNAGLSFTLGDTASEDYTPTELNGTWTAAWGGGTFYTDDGVLSGFGGQFGQEYKDLFYSSSYMSAPLTMTIIEGGVLSGADLRGCGNVRVTSGGKIMNAKIKGVGVGINSGGYASGLSALTDPDRTASQTQIWAYGSGATLDGTVLNGGLLGLEIGAVANGVTMTAPEGYTGGPGDAEHYGPAELDIYAGGTANDVVASAGIITLEGGSYKEPGTAGPTLNNADVHSSASIIVMSDDGVMSGKLNLGGTVVTTAKRTEYVPVEVDDVDAEGNPIHYTDYQPVEKNNATVDATNLTVNFDLTERNGSEEYAMIDNLANLQGAKLGTITISAEQKSGSYVLAGGAEAFKGSLTVTCGSENIGSISAGNSLQGNKGTVYKLSNTTDDGLVFSVMAGDVKPTDVPADFSVSVKNSNAAFSWKKAPVPKGLTATYEIRVNGGEKTFKTSSNKYTSTMDVGKYTFEIRTLLSDGSVSEWSDPVEVEVKDVTPPVLKSLTVTQSGEDSVLVEWTPAEDNVGVDHYIVTCGNMEPVEVPGNEHSYEFFGLGGQVTVTLTAADAAGNTGKALKQSLKIEDVTPPDQVTGLTAEDKGKAGVILSWEKPYDNVGVTDYKITVDGKEYKSKTNSLKVSGLAAGEHSFTVVALDKAKNESDPSEDCLFEVADLTPPVTGALSLEQDGEDGVRLTWMPATDNSGSVDHYVVTCGEQEDTVDSPELEYTFYGVAGKVTATLTAVDAAGNAGKTVKKTITLKDMTLPDQVTGLYAGEVDNKSGGVLAWDKAEDNVGVTQYLISVEDENGKKTSYTSKTNSVKVKKMPAGEYTFTVVAEDKAKNKSDVGEIGVFEVADVIDPKIRKLSAKVNKDNSATVTWSATDETKLDRVEYTLSLGDDVISMDTEYGESGTLHFEDLAAGNYALRMTAYDLADNESVEKKVSFKIKGNLASLS